MSKVFSNTKVDKVGIEDRINRITKRSLKGSSKIQGLKMILSMIDLTTLEGMDTPKKVEQLCYKATHLHIKVPNLPNVDDVCETECDRETCGRGQRAPYGTQEYQCPP